MNWKVPTPSKITQKIASFIVAPENDDKTINSILRFDFIDAVRSKNIDQSDQEAILELVGIDYLKNNDVYEINLIFNNNAHIALSTETIEARLEDQSEIT